MDPLESRSATDQECLAVQQALGRLNNRNRIIALIRSRLGPSLRAHRFDLAEHSALIRHPHLLTLKLQEQNTTAALFIELAQCAEQVFDEHQRLVERRRWRHEAQACITAIRQQQEQKVPHGFRGKLAERCRGLSRALKTGQASELKDQVTQARVILNDTQLSAGLKQHSASETHAG